MKRGIIQKSGTSVEADLVCLFKSWLFLMLQSLQFLSFQDFAASLGAAGSRCGAFQTRSHRFLSWRMTFLTLTKHCAQPPHPVPGEGCQPQHPWNCLSPRDSPHRVTQGHRRDHTAARAAGDKCRNRSQPAGGRDHRKKNGSTGMKRCQRLPLWAQIRSFIRKWHTVKRFPVRLANSRA